MFFLRSVFWLIVGFVLVAPHGTDFGAAASALREQATIRVVQAGQDMLVSEMQSKKFSASALLDLTRSTPSADLPMQDSPAMPAVFPRPRPAAMG